MTTKKETCSAPCYGFLILFIYLFIEKKIKKFLKSQKKSLMVKQKDLLLFLGYSKLTRLVDSELIDIGQCLGNCRHRQSIFKVREPY